MRANARSSGCSLLWVYHSLPRVYCACLLSRTTLSVPPRLASSVGGCCPLPGLPRPFFCCPPPCPACIRAIISIWQIQRSKTVCASRISPVSGSVKFGGGAQFLRSYISAFVHQSIGKPVFLACIITSFREIELNSCKLYGVTVNGKFSMCH